ncbi:hypothetical protein AA313_de0207655 [Arthrobotrys entomopaga]|nr:hypothetical protein AA313_de0207655 [Arthrobotrys entomopaga]
MPRRGLFRQAEASGVFQSLYKDERRQTKVLRTIPVPISGGEPTEAATRNEQTPIAITIGQVSQDIGDSDVAEHTMPGAFPSSQVSSLRAPPTSLRATPTRRTVHLQNNNVFHALVQAAERQRAIDGILQRHSLQAKPSRLGRFVRSLFSRDQEPAFTDYRLPLPQAPTSWNDIRNILNVSENPPPTPAEEAQWWNDARYQLGLPIPPPWQIPSPQFPQIPVEQPVTVIQTPHGPMYLNTPRYPTIIPPHQQSGLPIDTPWTQWDTKQIATLFFLAGMKLTWNAATSMWEALSLAWDHNMEDQMRIRDQQNAEMAFWAQLGLPTPPQQAPPPPPRSAAPFGMPIPGPQPLLPGSWI